MAPGDCSTSTPAATPFPLLTREPPFNGYIRLERNYSIAEPENGNSLRWVVSVLAPPRGLPGGGREGLEYAWRWGHGVRVHCYGVRTCGMFWGHMTPGRVSLCEKRHLSNASRNRQPLCPIYMGGTPRKQAATNHFCGWGPAVAAAASALWSPSLVIARSHTTPHRTASHHTTPDRTSSTHRHRIASAVCATPSYARQTRPAAHVFQTGQNSQAQIPV